MKTSTKMLLFTLLFTSTIFVLNSNSWINMWIGMEINLMSFIPLMYEQKNSFLSQSIMMYFLTQSMASMIFIATILMNELFYMNNSLMKITIMASMMMKMGMPPFHSWFPEVSNKISWPMCFILMTWQKMAPMQIMSMILELNLTTMSMICMSAMMGAIGGLNQTSTQKIMAYSSMNHMSWMIACAASFKKSWTTYLMIYTSIMLMMSAIMYNYNIMFINQMNFTKKTMEKITIITLILSIGGIPPFIGFIPKWITIQYMISSKEMIMMLIMVISSLITLSYYLRLSSSINLLMSYSQKWMYMFYMKKSITTTIMSLNLMLPMLILYMNFN